jgi:hypothetical protein
MARAEKKQEVATRGGNGGGVTITDDMLKELIADAGAGISTAAEDNLIPIILLLQDMSPEVKKRDPNNYVEGAEAGMYMNRATKQLWAGDKAMSERTGKPMLEFQYCYLDKGIVEWVPRTEGGGFIARYPLDGDVESAMRKIGGRKGRDPNDPNKSVWKAPESNNDLIETRYHFGHIFSRQWTTMAGGFMTEVAHPDTGELVLVKQPVWWRKYIVGSKARENKKGSFFVGTIADGDVIPNASIRAMGKAMYEAAKAGTVRAGAEDYAGDGGGGEVSDEI